jgi:hypothetical protein
LEVLGLKLHPLYLFILVCSLEVPAEETRNLGLFFTWVWELRLLLCAAFITKLDIIRGEDQMQKPAALDL